MLKADKIPAQKNYGLLNNRWASHRCYKEEHQPRVGMGATYYAWSDRYPLTVIEVNKNWNTLSAIGCGREDFKVYIESLFAEGMNWSNYGMGDGKWSIDHIKPLSTAQTEQDVFELSHYSNLQPMWWIENVIKSNKHQEQD